MAEDVKEEKVTEEVTENKADAKPEAKESKPNREPRKEFRRDNRERGDYGYRRMRRKICLLCKEKNYVLDYKDEETVKRFVNEKGKILPRRATGTCAKHQREIAQVVKRARHLAVLP